MKFSFKNKPLEKAPKKSFNEIYVEHRLDPAEKYLGKFITCSDIENDDWIIINKNQSKRVICDNVRRSKVETKSEYLLLFMS